MDTPRIPKLEGCAVVRAGVTVFCRPGTGRPTSEMILRGWSGLSRGAGARRENICALFIGDSFQPSAFSLQPSP